MAKFAKGKSGNPGGRPKEPVELKDLACAHSKEALERLAFWMRSDNAKASVTASMAILDRAFGKPLQMNEHTGKDGKDLIPETGPLETARRVAFLLAQGLNAS